MLLLRMLKYALVASEELLRRRQQIAGRQVTEGGEKKMLSREPN